jgi:hypothetical protein
MIHVRAGLIYNISHDKITKQHVSEIFYWSNDVNFISVLKMIEEILLIDPNINYSPPVDFNINIYFGNFHEVAYNHLKNVGMNVLAFYFLEYCKFKVIDNPVSSWNKNTKGLKEEEFAIFRFNNVYGYNIVKARRGIYKVDGFDLSISGTPDGIVQSSPGGIFDDHLVEIKYQPRISEESKMRNKYQIACYSKIFNKPVMLIIYTNNNYTIHRFTMESLNKFWNNNIMPKLIKGFNQIKDVVKVKSLSDLHKYNSFIESAN